MYSNSKNDVNKRKNNNMLSATGTNYSDQRLSHLQLYLHHLKVPRFFISLVNHLSYKFHLLSQFQGYSQIAYHPEITKEKKGGFHLF